MSPDRKPTGWQKAERPGRGLRDAEAHYERRRLTLSAVRELEEARYAREAAANLNRLWADFLARHPELSEAA